MRVSIWTGMFNPEEAKYANGMVVDLLHPTDDLVWPPRDYAERLLERRNAASSRAFRWQIGLHPLLNDRLTIDQGRRV